MRRYKHSKEAVGELVVPSGDGTKKRGSGWPEMAHRVPGRQSGTFAGRRIAANLSYMGMVKRRTTAHAATIRQVKALLSALAIQSARSAGWLHLCQIAIGRLGRRRALRLWGFHSVQALPMDTSIAAKTRLAGDDADEGATCWFLSREKPPTRLETG